MIRADDGHPYLGNLGERSIKPLTLLNTQIIGAAAILTDRSICYRVCN